MEKIWALVNHATPSQRQQAQASSATLRPYLALYDLAATEGLSPAGLSRALVQFNQVYRGHPVSEYMPASVVAGAELRTEQPREVAVLLPLSGKLGATGTTIKEGLLSAYYDQASALRTTQHAELRRLAAFIRLLHLCRDLIELILTLLINRTLLLLQSRNLCLRRLHLSL